ncbi:FadR/GntR family transcriptional regulator [Tropicimonas marinistellae]|uniref:FadR/GntR family transcriptional regulator n=1 Tax=Tropicimonas marinistellae TaxID=1739787 RepID=UPI0013731945|nr:FCD domain-containing protein [Tropicimonas marinistellae]
MLDVRKFIHDNKLSAGDVLPSENAIATQLGVSRTVAREALRGLAALRILEVGNGRRARVAGPTAEALSVILDHTVYTKQLSVAQIQDVRRTLEMRTVSLAALHRSDDDARQLLETCAKMMEAVEHDSTAVMEQDILFHEIIARASGNPLYSILVDSFRIITRQTWDIGWRARATLENRVENIKCHERIATAIMAQEAVRAEAAMSEHFDSSFMVLLRAGVN